MLKEVGCGSNTPPPGDLTTAGQRDNPSADERLQLDNNSNSGALTCGGCGRDITERFILRVGERAWHCKCLRCSRCRMPLAAEEKCYFRGDNIYCKEDYYRLGVSRCSSCQAGIFSREFVMRVRELVYHENCFRCASCQTQLRKGDHFGQRGGLIYCWPHYEETTYCPIDYGNTSVSGSIDDLGSPGVSPMAGYYSAAEQSPVASTVQKGRPRKRKLSEATSSEMAMRLSGGMDLLHPNELSSSMESLTTYDASVGSPGPIHQSQRTKRMRTSFKHHQLKTMKSYFSVNQNPDAKDLKQLASKTQLSKRVLQVWFQNARAKWRRNSMRQDGNNGVNSIGACPGTPVTSSTGNSPNICSTSAFLDSNSQPSTSMDDIHSLHHLHSGISPQISFSDLY